MEGDDEVARHRVHPLIDHSLGIVFFFLILKTIHYCFTSPGPILFQFGIGVAGALIGIIAVGRFADHIGQRLSKAREGKNIPLDCRNPLSSRVAKKKWRDQAWQLLLHLSMTLWELRILNSNPQWWTHPVTIFQPCPETLFPVPEEFYELQFFLLIQLALWIWTGVSCKWLEERRKDYVEMLLHHCLTVALVLGAMIKGEFAISVVVLFIHDCSDIVLDLTKMANYLKLENAHGFYIVEIIFVLNTYVVWPYLRLYRFPVYVIHGIFAEYRRVCMTPETSWPGTSLEALCMLSALFLLHVYWWFLLNKISWKMITGQVANKAADDVYEITMKDSKKSR